ncbi:MAG TPA: hypothetical protein P5089_02140 [Candidatus Portnoybacteria bacterium]|nr:hypothetical protein [Candidatus Portnoybacteria bacterium]
MKKYLKNHINFIEGILAKEGAAFDWSSLRESHRIQIGFLQHERLIHLLVTLFFGVVFFFSVTFGLFLGYLEFLALSAILLVMLVFYVWHYFVLENGVQKLYRLDNEISEHLKK